MSFPPESSAMLLQKIRKAITEKHIWLFRLITCAERKRQHSKKIDHFEFTNPAAEHVRGGGGVTAIKRFKECNLNGKTDRVHKSIKICRATVAPRSHKQIFKQFLFPSCTANNETTIPSVIKNLLNFREHLERVIWPQTTSLLNNTINHTILFQSFRRENRITRERTDYGFQNVLIYRADA